MAATTTTTTTTTTTSFYCYCYCYCWCCTTQLLLLLLKLPQLLLLQVSTWMSMLTFDKFNGKFDTRVKGLGLDYMVSDIQNTVLKEPKVGKNIPTVAKVRTISSSSPSLCLPF